MNLSFSVGQSGWKRAVFIVLLVGGSFTGFIWFMAWYCLLGGEEKLERKTLKKLAKGDPVADAKQAIKDEDYTLLGYSDMTDLEVPGCSHLHEKNKQGFTFNIIPLINDPISKEDEELNKKVISYMDQYNIRIYEYVKSHFKNDQTEQKKINFKVTGLLQIWMIVVFVFNFTAFAVDAGFDFFTDKPIITFPVIKEIYWNIILALPLAWVLMLESEIRNRFLELVVLISGFLVIGYAYCYIRRKDEENREARIFGVMLILMLTWILTLVLTAFFEMKS
ncbi:hypothetical protein ACFL6F_04155 [Planctomycetota bacterium]